MRKISSITFAAVVAAAVTPAFAGEYDDLCQSMATYAESVMKLRQVGVPMGELLKIIKKNKNGAASIKSREIVILAYAQPHYLTLQVQRRTISDFRDQIHVSCLSGAASE